MGQPPRFEFAKKRICVMMLPVMRQWLWRSTTLLIVLHLAVLFAGRWGLNVPESAGRLFFLDQEYNIPAFYSALLFVLCAYYCARLGYAAYGTRKLHALTWELLGGLLLFLAADEWFELHERLIVPLRAYFGVEQGIFYFSWTIAYLGLVILVAALTAPWLLGLERRFRNALFQSAALYVTGALGFEMVGSWVYSMNGHEYTPTYANIVAIEESLELIGLTLAVLALSGYIARQRRISQRVQEEVVLQAVS
jgi:hypothetical protein